MVKYTHVCDNCKVEVEKNNSYTPDGWRTIKIEYEGSAYSNLAKQYMLCPKCQSKLTLPLKEEKFISVEARGTVQDRLFDIICEITNNNR